MKIIKLLTLLVLLLSTSAYSIADVAESAVNVGANPGGLPPQICVYDRDLIISPDQLLADAPTINIFKIRSGMYAFTGEQIEIRMVVRDPNGALDIGHAFKGINDNAAVLCNPDSLPQTCDGLRPTGANNGLLNGVTDSTTDRGFHCLYTVPPTTPNFAAELKIGVTDANGQITNSLYTENWIFNPAISIDVSTSDGNPISFESGQPGNYVHSLNKLIVRNNALGGVNFWLFIAASDLTDPTGVAKCPITNKIDVDGASNQNQPDTGLWYRARTGSIVTEPIVSTDQQGWAHITNPNQNFGCGFDVSLGVLPVSCNGAKPLFSTDPLKNVLTNGGTAEVEFKLLYPVPCIGTFSQGKIFVFGKPI